MYDVNFYKYFFLFSLYNSKILANSKKNIQWKVQYEIILNFIGVMNWLKYN